MKLQSNKWYKATPSYPTKRTIYTQQVIDTVNLGGLYMIIENGYCQFFQYADMMIHLAYDVPIYSCTRETAKRKFNFTEL